MQQPPQFNQPPPYYNQQPPPVYQPQPQSYKSALKATGVILIISRAVVFVFGLCTLVIGGIGLLFILLAIPMFVGGLVALAFA